MLLFTCILHLFVQWLKKNEQKNYFAQKVRKVLLGFYFMPFENQSINYVNKNFNIQI